MLLSELLATPGLAGISVLAGPTEGSARSARLLRTAEEITRCSPGTLAVLLGPHLGHRLDLALRDAVRAGLAALLVETDAAIPVTAQRIAERGELCLLHTPRDPVELFLIMRDALLGDATAALSRLDTAARALRSGEADPLEIAAQAIGEPVRHDGATAGECTVTFGENRLSGGADTPFSRIVLSLAAAVHAAGVSTISARSRGGLLAELLSAPAEHALSLAARARALGLAIDGTHTVARIEPSASTGTERYRLLATAEREIQGLDHPCAQRTTCTADDAVHVLLTEHHDRPEPRSHAGQLLDHIRTRLPGHGFRCGVGTAHQGPRGIQASAREARGAVQRLEPDATAPGYYDAAGLDRMLFDWYSSTPAREAVTELLGPLLCLGAHKAEPLIAALQSYLDHNGSPSNAAAALHLHRNAVSQRVRRAGELLAADLDDPEQRLRLQLACRAYFA